MDKNEVKKQVKDFKLDYLGNDCIMIQNRFFNFTYFIADKVVKEEFKGKYRYFGGLQSSYKKDSLEYKYLEDLLCDIAESVFKSKINQ